MEKGTRTVKCPHCLPEVTRIEIKVTAAVYGKNVNVVCRKCTSSFEITIPVPAAEPKQTPSGFQFGSEPFGDAFGDIFGDLFKPKK